MTNIETYYQLSSEVKAGLNGKLHEMNPGQQLKAKQVLEAFEAAERTFYDFRKRMTELNDAAAWINLVNAKSDNGNANHWKKIALGLKSCLNGHRELDSEIIGWLNER